MTRAGALRAIAAHGDCPCVTEPGWHTSKGPLAVLAQHDDRPVYAVWRHWIDHAYRLRDPDGSWTYIAEPYSIGEEALDDFAVLRAAGWSVSITATGARHAPGHTVAVRIRPEAAS
jgi:hypothetical protein